MLPTPITLRSTQRAAPPVDLRTLAKFHGAMWSCRWNGRYGPRPGDPSNILAMDYYEWFNDAERAEMLQIYKGQHPQYTHAVTGPFIDAGGYHGNFPQQPTMPTDAQLAHYLDCMAEWRDCSYGRILPVHFVHPDGWTFEQTRDQFTEFYSDRRVHELLPIIIPTGWEPTRYGWSSYTWRAFLDWMLSIHPGALIGIHTVNDVDAPVGSDERGTDNNNGLGWARVAPACHMWLIQNGPYDVTPAENPQLAKEFGAQFKADGDGAAYHSARWHFVNGIGSWPRGSAWGPDEAVHLINAEVTTYNEYHRNLPESLALDWGDTAMQAGADGYLDGGRG